MRQFMHRQGGLLLRDWEVSFIGVDMLDGWSLWKNYVFENRRIRRLTRNTKLRCQPQKASDVVPTHDLRHYAIQNNNILDSTTLHVGDTDIKTIGRHIAENVNSPRKM